MTEPAADTALVSADLLRYEAQSKALYKALAEYQGDQGKSLPSEFGLAVFHQVQRIDGDDFIEAVLVHEEGGSITSGLLQFDTELLTTCQFATLLVLGVSPSLESDFAPAPPVAIQQDPPAPAAAEAPPDPQEAPPDPQPEPDATPRVEQVSDATPTAEQVEEVMSLVDQLHQKDPTAMKGVAEAYWARFTRVGRQPLAKSITTMERQQFLVDHITARLNDPK
jgi:hypothetical protein